MGILDPFQTLSAKVARREEYALDAPVDDSVVVPEVSARDVPNQALVALDAKLREARAVLSRLQAEYGLEALVNPDDERPKMRDFKRRREEQPRSRRQMEGGGGSELGRILLLVLSPLTPRPSRRWRAPASH